jgi:protein phosphatase
MNAKDETNLSWAFLTDVGLKRTANEDSGLILTLNLDVVGEHSTIGLFVVSDGMGGKERGELASKIAVKTLGEAFVDSFLRASLRRVSEVANYGERLESDEAEVLSSPATFLTNAIQQANRRIGRLRKNGQPVKTGATVTAGIITDDLLTLGHVGDCRAYLLYENNLRQLTQDHNVVNEMVKKGILSREEGQEHPQRSILSRALGSQESVEVDTSVTVLQSGCKILLCTDGLHSLVSEKEIVEIMSRPDHPKIITGELVNLANQAGGKDNITVLVINFL